MVADSQAENATLVRAVIEALNRGDWADALGSLAPEFEYDLTRTTSPLRGVYGRAQMPGVVEEFLGAWESVRYEPREFIEAPEGLVVPFATHFRGRDGIEMQTDATWLWTIESDRIVRLTLFQDHDEALAAAGV